MSIRARIKDALTGHHTRTGPPPPAPHEPHEPHEPRPTTPQRQRQRERERETGERLREVRRKADQDIDPHEDWPGQDGPPPAP
ncbi:hypothetical protein [Streptomyces sp. ISL-11]|uniref:hypothetical protein n=1 Tax=Streptomyces sp. ISL-11 TaxID=2819174 RepID=UPI001BECB830|nr:hypothetical protein [Streptomyces sp. ISL-11]MBT2386587.1 hypothetical protein [Streptomyces sp. ISL-11]